MIKIITLLTALILSTTIFSQDSLKSYKFVRGIKNNKDSVTWIRESSIYCDILVDINDNKIKIYSSEIKEYDIINCEIDYIGVSPDDPKITNRFRTFLISDKESIFHCSIGSTNQLITFLMIEYTDFVWLYFIKQD